MNNLYFQYCPKLSVLSNDKKSVFLCRRKGEQDYDGIFSMIGGKMEHADEDILRAIEREKNEEVGQKFKVMVFPKISVDIDFSKKDGSKMILPHFMAYHISGTPILSEEYSENIWVPLDQLEHFEPKISNIFWITELLIKATKDIAQNMFIEI